MKKIGMFMLFMMIVVGLFSTSVEACELTVDRTGSWLHDDGSPASEEEITLCTEESQLVYEQEAEPNYKLLRVMSIGLSLTLTACVPLFFAGLIWIVCFALLKKRLKIPLIFLGVVSGIMIVMYIVSIFMNSVAVPSGF